jgi:hypothetical protein
MYNHHINSSYGLMKPEYFALWISIIAIFVSLYTSKRNREHILAKELYFKYQQNSEKIISKLLILQNQRNKFFLWINETWIFCFMNINNCNLCEFIYIEKK